MADLKLESDDERECIQELQSYFATERDEELGWLAARLLYDFAVERIAWRFFNVGIDEAQKVIARGAAGIDADLDATKLLPPRDGR